MPEVKPSDIQTFASIIVVGVGGAGGSAVNRMKDAGLSGVQFIAMNTDAQALHNSKADVKIHLGHTTTNGLGAGADPSVGEEAARESIDEISENTVREVLFANKLRLGKDELNRLYEP